MGGQNFWGVINHDNAEGIIRIANNDVTSGLKLWTWGYDSVEIDPFAQPGVENRPYIEMWAGVTPEFFTKTVLEPDAEVVIEETYTPTVDLTNVTQANRDYLANFYADDAGSAQLQLFSVHPDREVNVVITANGETLYDEPLVAQPGVAAEISVEVPANAESVTFALIGEDGIELLTGTL
jgi:hypothetical protein